MMRNLVVKAALTWALVGFCNAFQMRSPLSPPRFPARDVNCCTRLHASVPITTLLTTLDTFWQTSPYAAAAIVCGFKASAADMVAQKRDYRKRAEKERKSAEEIQVPKSMSQESANVVYNPDESENGITSDMSDVAAASASTVSKKTDWKRNTAFLVYGALYQGVAQEHIYNHLYPVWFGSGTSTSVVLAKVLFDLLVQTTLVTLPIAYITKSLIYRYSFREAMTRYVDDIRNHGLLKKYFLLWGPVQCITFSVVPEHWRVTFIASVSFFWLIILSTIASKTKPITFSAAMKEETVEECSLDDGLTCNIDG